MADPKKTIFELFKQMRLELGSSGGTKTPKYESLVQQALELAGTRERYHLLYSEFDRLFRQSQQQRRREKMMQLTTLCVGYLGNGLPLPFPLVKLARALGSIRQPTTQVPPSSLGRNLLHSFPASERGGKDEAAGAPSVTRAPPPSASVAVVAKPKKVSKPRKRAKLEQAPAVPLDVVSELMQRERNVFLNQATPSGLGLDDLRSFYREKLFLMPTSGQQGEVTKNFFLQSVILRAKEMQMDRNFKLLYCQCIVEDVVAHTTELEQRRMRQLKSQDLDQYLDELRSRNDDRIQEIVKQTQSCLRQIMSSLQLHNHLIFDQQKADDQVELSLKELIFSKAKDVVVPIGLGGGPDSGLKLKSYQVDGLKWLVSLDDYNLNGILADEMGLGKTVQTIAFILYLHENGLVKGQHVIVAPMAVVPNWIDQFEQWAPQIRVAHWTARVPIAERTEYFHEQVRKADVVVTTYEWIRDHQKRKSIEKWGQWPHLHKIKWHLVVADEGHHIANNTSQKSRALRQLTCIRKMILTGTPLQNSLSELWALLNYLMPHVFQNDQDFEDWFASPFTGDEKKVEMSDEEKTLVILRLHKVLAPFMLRRVKQDVASELPPVIERVLACDLSLFQIMMLEYVSRGEVPLVPGHSRKQIMSSGAGMMRKVCNHPLLVYTEMGSSTTFPWDLFADHFDLESFILSSGKFVVLDVVLQKLKLSGHRVLVYSPWTQTLEMLAKVMELRGHSYRMLTGATNGDDRERFIQEFTEDESIFVFLVSTHAGGEGVNLQAADTVIVFETDWNPQKDKQAKARVHRIGQERKVLILTLVSVGENSESHDQRKFMRADGKRKMEEKVIGAGNFVEATTDLDRLHTMKQMYKDEDDGNGPNYRSTDELDRLISRSDSELALLRQHVVPMPELISLEKLPTWFLSPAPKESRLRQNTVIDGAGRRHRVKSYREVRSDGELSSSRSSSSSEQEQEERREYDHGNVLDDEENDENDDEENAADDGFLVSNFNFDDNDVGANVTGRIGMGSSGFFGNMGSMFHSDIHALAAPPPPPPPPLDVTVGAARSSMFTVSLGGHDFDDDDMELGDELDLDAF